MMTGNKMNGKFDDRWGIKMSFEENPNTYVMKWRECDPTRPQHCRKEVEDGVCMRSKVIDADFQSETW